MTEDLFFLQFNTRAGMKTVNQLKGQQWSLDEQVFADARHRQRVRVSSVSSLRMRLMCQVKAKFRASFFQGSEVRVREICFLGWEFESVHSAGDTDMDDAHGCCEAL